MSDKLIQQVWKNFPEGGAPLNMMLAIAESASEQGGCHLPAARLAYLSRMSRSTAFAAIDGLRKARWIATSRMMGRGGLCLYQLNLSKLDRSVRLGCD
jgi:hypothetical protein